MSRIPKISIIIPTRSLDGYVCESIFKILGLNWNNYEVIVLAQRIQKMPVIPKLRIIKTNAHPAEKRNLALKFARGKILAFLDDDAYPKADWLKRTIVHFSDKKVAAVGGPAVTPLNDSFWQKISGSVYESFLGGGLARHRYLPLGKKREVDDWPSVNLLVKKNVFQKINGFNKNYWTGEDTKLCLDIVNLGYKIIYEPGAIVFHHRRNGLLKHLDQIGRYALHRGYFAKKFPQTSFRLWYFIPSILVLYLIFLITLVIGKSPFLLIFAIPLFVYLFCLIIDGLIILGRYKDPFISLTALPTIVLTHLWYGIKFLEGLILPKL